MMTPKMFKSLFFILIFIFTSVSCTNMDTFNNSKYKADEKSEASISSNYQISGIKKAINALNVGDLDKASVGFNNALMLDPNNSYLQFLNGITYHLMAQRGDSSKYSMAEQGYILAIKFDASNWLARGQLGLLKLDTKNFLEAQNVLSEALLYNDRDGDLLYSTVVASYFAKDLETAKGVLNRLEEIEGTTERVLRTQAMLNASLGDGKTAGSLLQQYNQKHSSQDVNNLKNRLTDWNDFYKKYRRGVQAGLYKDDIKNNTGARILIEGTKTNQQGTILSPTSLENTESQYDDIEQDKLASKLSMVIVDVVILRTEETIGTSVGVNLLNGLKLQFGSVSDYDASPAWGSKYEYDYSTGSTVTDNIVRSLSIPALTYSLNIFNSQNNRSEVLARPSLVASFDEESTFFSGSEIDASAVGGGDGEPVTIQKEVGIKLAITPRRMENGLIGLSIDAERTFLKSPSDSIEFDYKIETSKTKVSANVSLRSGETLLLSGLSEKESQVVRDGVPILQDIPIIQHLFSEKKVRDFKKSVLILVTPRLPNYIYRKKTKNGVKGGGVGVSELQAKYSDWFRPYPNWASVFHHMQSNSLYREFRTGDVTMEKWQHKKSFLGRIKMASKLLYY
ncbi:MAG: Tfp pilus assembly protein PilF [Francisellaceae bacterium]|jgi:Tfp pilus assembly protein PilF